MHREKFTIHKIISKCFVAILVTSLVANLFLIPAFADDDGFALRFDGTSDSVELSTAETIVGTGWTTTKSVALWVKPDGLQVDCIITPDLYNATECVSIFGDYPTFWGITIGHLVGPNQNRIWVWNYDNAWPSDLDYIGIVYTPGEWVHIAMVHNNGMLRAYKNGVLVGSTPSGPTQQPPGNGGILTLGGVIYNETRYYLFQGDIDEVSLWDRALSAAEISANMYQDWPTEPTGLAAFYRMSDGSGTSLTDNSGNGHTGKLVDGARGLPGSGQPAQWVDSTAFDVNGPSVTINQAIGQSDPTTDSPINFTVVFAEGVTDFTTGDVSLAGTAGATTAIVTAVNSTTYNVAVSGMANSGTVIATVDTGVAHNSLNQPNQASTSTDNTVQFDTSMSGPTVTINLASGQAATTSTSPINFTVVFSEAVADFATGDVSLYGTAGATTAIVTSINSTTYNVAVSGMHRSGTVIATVPPGVAHGAGNNPNAASTTSGNTVNYLDNTGPSVTINQAPGQADPAPSPPIRFRVIFSEPVDDFGTTDVNLSASTAPGALYVAVFGSGTDYDVEISGMTGYGTVVASLNGSVVTDATGNPNSPSTSTDNSVLFINAAFSLYLPITMRY